MTGCDQCDDQNVWPPDTLYYAGRDLHRALHDLVRPIEQFLIDRILEPLARTLNT